MWRTLFLAIGISALLLGAECLVVHKAIFMRPATAADSGPTAFGQFVAPPASQREFQPPEWAPWSLLAGGAVILLYSFTVPGKAAE